MSWLESNSVAAITGMPITSLALRFNTPEAKAQLEFYMDCVQKGVVDPVVFNDTTNFVIDAFFTNKVAIGYIGTWAIAEGLTNFPDFNDEWGYVFLPPTQGKPIFVADSGWGLSVFTQQQASRCCPICDFVSMSPPVSKNAEGWNIAVCGHDTCLAGKWPKINGASHREKMPLGS